MRAQWNDMSSDERTTAMNGSILDGLTASQAAEPLGATRNGIIGHSRRHGIRHVSGVHADHSDAAQPAKTWKTMDRAERLTAITEAIANNKTAAEVAEIYSASVSAISKFAIQYAPMSFADRQEANREDLRRTAPDTWRGMSTEERVAALKAAAAAGESMLVAADRLEVSPGTVKKFCITHLKGCFHVSRPAPERAEHQDVNSALVASPDEIAAAMEESEPMRDRQPVPPAIPGGIPFIALEHQHCRAPVWSEEQGATGDYRFCGGRQREGSAYCDAHHARMHADPGECTGPRTGAVATMATTRVRGRAA